MEEDTEDEEWWVEDMVVLLAEVLLVSGLVGWLEVEGLVQHDLYHYWVEHVLCSC